MLEEVQVIRVFIIDYHAVVAMGVSSVLAEFQDIEVTGYCEKEEDALALIEHYRPDILLVDLDFSDQIKRMDLIRGLRINYPQTRILIFTNSMDEKVVSETLQSGVNGYVLKNISSQELALAIRNVHKGKSVLSPEITKMIIHQLSVANHNTPNLTKREYQVLELIVHGKNNQEIAEYLNISLPTVQFHVSNILGKLEVHNRTEAAIYAIRNNLAT